MLPLISSVTRQPARAVSDRTNAAIANDGVTGGDRGPVGYQQEPEGACASFVFDMMGSGISARDPRHEPIIRVG